jgi:hypothetical protein
MWPAPRENLQTDAVGLLESIGVSPEKIRYNSALHQTFEPESRGRITQELPRVESCLAQHSTFLQIQQIQQIVTCTSLFELYVLLQAWLHPCIKNWVPFYFQSEPQRQPNGPHFLPSALAAAVAWVCLISIFLILTVLDNMSVTQSTSISETIPYWSDRSSRKARVQSSAASPHPINLLAMTGPVMVFRMTKERLLSLAWPWPGRTAQVDINY